MVKATLNGQLIHENVAIKGLTGAALTGREAATGPLMFQGDHGVVAYRNIQITPAAGGGQSNPYPRYLAGGGENCASFTLTLRLNTRSPQVAKSVSKFSPPKTHSKLCRSASG